MISEPELLSAIRNRRSVREFDDRPVERNKIRICLEAARLAPSADNVQPWRFIVIDDPELKQDFGKTVFSGIYRVTRWALKAPVLLLILSDLHFFAHKIGGRVQKIPYYFIDIGIAGEHIALQAQNMGLGTCWIGWFDVKKAQKFFNIPKTIRVCEMMALGYPFKDWKPRSKKIKSLQEIVFINGWSKASDQEEL
jgi:nitroreductase